jgi:hypothetical protein
MPHPAHSIEVRISPASRRRLSRLLRESRVLTEQRLQAIFRSAGVRAGLLPGGRIFERETGALDPAGVERLAQQLDLATDLAQAILPVALRNLRTLDRKQLDYGEHNLTRFGTYGVLVRMTDKLERLITLQKHGTLDSPTTAHFESAADTLLDLANYALICHAMAMKRWPREVVAVKP